MSLGLKSIKNIWHPFTQMNIADIPTGILRAKDEFLYDDEGNEIIDAISSWWTSIHGHSNQHIAEQLYKQALTLDHVIFAGFTHKPAVQIAERLIRVLPKNQSKVFFSDNGSTAVEVALKMAFQYWSNKEKVKTKVIALKSSYHGDTFGAMSVGSRSAFTKAFFPFLFDVEFIESPAIDSERSLKELKELVRNKDVAAFIYEPLVQGAGGMLMYSKQVLNEMMKICKKAEVLCIADEVMTGFYRTAKFFASDYLATEPDIMCLSKGLTGGVMALGITSCTEKIYKAFLSDDFMDKTFFHGHSFTANPLACSVANASLDLLISKECKQNIERITRSHAEFLDTIKSYRSIENLRQLGTIIAFDLKTNSETGYANSKRNEILSFFKSCNILLRPLGNTIYILPPYCISDTSLFKVYNSIEVLIKKN